MDSLMWQKQLSKFFKSCFNVVHALIDSHTSAPNWAFNAVYFSKTKWGVRGAEPPGQKLSATYKNFFTRARDYSKNPKRNPDTTIVPNSANSLTVAKTTR